MGEIHVVDLIDNSPDAPAGCNLHSWSDQGAWSARCYTSDHAQAQCMWDKPREPTVHTGNGYENAADGGASISPLQALSLWKNSAGHNAVILNEGIWAGQTWNALGAGVQGGYAALWFGSSVDPANSRQRPAQRWFVAMAEIATGCMQASRKLRTGIGGSLPRE